MLKKILRISVLVGFIGLLLYTFYYLYQKNQEPDEVFETASPVYTDIIKKTVATGSVVPRQEIEIKPQISGIIEKLYVEEGDDIKTGDLIAKIKVIPDMISLNNAENRLASAQISFENAKVDYERNQQLFKNEVIPQTEFQDSELRYKNAQQELDAARENLQIVKEGISEKKGSVSNTLIRSTKTGTVLEVPVEEGNSVIEANNFNDGTTVAIVADLTDMIFEGKVDESEVGKINTGMDIVLTIGAIEDEEYHAELEFISPKGAEENGAIQFLIRAALKLREGNFVRAGYSANAEIVLDKRDSVLAINESLITFSHDTVFIEVEVEEQQFERREIELGLSDGIYAEVLSEMDTTIRIKMPNLKDGVVKD